MRSRSHHLPFAPLLLSLLLGCFVLGSAAQWALAQEQQYTVWPYNVKHKQDTEIPKILRGNKPLEGNEDYVRKYFTEFYFAEMTQPENVQKLPDLRALFFKKIWQAQDAKAYTFVNEHTLNQMRELIRGKFHPAVKYNAILIVGDLDVGQRQQGGRQTKPVPYPGAVSTLLACATRPGFDDSIRAGALIGLLRHAEFGMVADSRESVIAGMRGLITQKQPPEGRDRAAHDWLRRRACEVLGFLGQTGGDNAVPSMLVDVMNDPQATLAFRCTAAETLGRLRYENAITLDTKKMTAGMCDLAIVVCDQSRQRIKTAGPDNAARLATALLLKLQTGLAAPNAVAEGADKALVKDVALQVAGMISKLEAGAGDSLGADLQQLGQDIAVKMGKGPAAAPAGTVPVSSETEKPGAKSDPSLPPASKSDPFGVSDPLNP